MSSREAMKIVAKNKIASIDDANANGARGLWRRAAVWWRRLIQITERRRQRRLRLCESLPLGDRRFVAVIEFEKARFLVGGTSGSLSLLSRLDSQESTGVVAAVDETPAAPREEQL